MTKKRFKFKVILIVEELNAVPFVTDVLFCKIRLRNGGAYSARTKCQNVSSHSVGWQQKFEFACKMAADPSTGILEPCVIRLSVRKEVRGGRSAVKMGYVDLNLAEFAGSSQKKKNCLLKGYNEKIRLNNSILKVIIGMQLLSGDPLFKVPQTQQDASLQFQSDFDDANFASPDSTPVVGGLSRRTSQIKHVDEMGLDEKGHMRNTSNISHISKRSDHSSKHSRSLSDNSQGSSNDVSSSQNRAALLFSKEYPSRPMQHQTFMTDSIQSRMGETRVSNDDIVTKLMESHDFSSNPGENKGNNLVLYVASDGSTTLGGNSFYNRVESGLYHPVIIETDDKQ